MERNRSSRDAQENITVTCMNELHVLLLNFCNYRTGGPWHITDMRRGESIFELDPNAHEEVEKGFETEGSNLSGVSARCDWAEQDSRMLGMENKDYDVLARMNDQDSLQKSLNNPSHELLSNNPMLESSELLHVRKFEGVHLVFNLEAGSLLPLAIRCNYYQFKKIWHLCLS